MNADRRNTLIAVSVAVGFNVRAKRSRGTICWGIRDTALRFGPTHVRRTLAVSLLIASGCFFFHLVNPLKESS